MLEVILFCAGIFIGVCATIAVSRMRRVGALRMYRENQNEDPYLFLDLDVPVSYITKHNYVVMKVSRK